MKPSDKFSDLRKQVRADPEREARVQAHKASMLAELDAAISAPLLSCSQRDSTPRCNFMLKPTLFPNSGPHYCKLPEGHGGVHVCGSCELVFRGPGFDGKAPKKP
jgi:hypothetical protein